MTAVDPRDIAVLVLAKSPRPGRVKTRLCPPCTPVQAAAIATAALEDTLTAVAALPVHRKVLVLDGPAGAWCPSSIAVRPQVAGDLATRLAGAFATVAGPAFLVGMDTPQLTVAGLWDALVALAAPGVDAVLGPSSDGGYWGIGLRHAAPAVFDRVPMSTRRTGAAQRARLDSLGLRTRFLPVLRDVDHYHDARLVAASIPHSRFAPAVDRVESARSVAAS